MANSDPLLIDIQYFPSLEYFIALVLTHKVILETCENYEKQSYRNRCYIKGANKILYITVPVLNGNSKVIVKDIKIDNSQKWLNLHWKTIASAYGKAPFFMFYGDLIKEILYKKHKFLIDLNTELLYKLLEILRFKIEINFTTEYKKETEKNINDLRSAIHPKRDYKLNNLYSPCRYNQIFGREFVGNLSILDLLFCEGNNAMKVLKESRAEGVSLVKK